MNITEKLLSINPFSRPGRLLAACKGIIFHYVGVANQRAINTWGFFEKACPLEKHYSSAHYIIDLNGDIYHAVPDNEVAYHAVAVLKTLNPAGFIRIGRGASLVFTLATL